MPQGLARDIDAVVVTVNYRVGTFGFLAHPALHAEAGTTGNFFFSMSLSHGPLPAPKYGRMFRQAAYQLLKTC